MENWKQYLPYIIGAAVVLYALNKMRSRTILAPQTQITQSPNIDPYLESRTSAFKSIVELTGKLAAEDTERIKSNVGLTVANRSFDTQVTLAKIYADAANYAANLNLLQREQDRRVQQSAIDRYYSSRNTSDIIGSIGTTLGNIFGNKSGGVFKPTPPINPGFSF